MIPGYALPAKTPQLLDHKDKIFKCIGQFPVNNSDSFQLQVLSFSLESQLLEFEGKNFKSGGRCPLQDFFMQCKKIGTIGHIDWDWNV